MKKLLPSFVLMLSMLLINSHAVASSAIDQMSDVELSEYAVRMSSVLETIQNNGLCSVADINCIKEECARRGVSYDDKDAVHKRMLLIIANIY